MKKIIAFICIISLTSFNYQEPVKLKFDFTEDETNLILEALGEMPAKKSFPVIQKILIESQKQMSAK